MSTGAFMISSAALVAGCLVLAVFIAGVLNSGDEHSAASIIQPDASIDVGDATMDSPISPGDVAGLEGVSLDVIEERPLFSSTRRPAQGDAGGQAPSSGLEELQLMGTMFWDDERRAVIRVEGEAKDQVVREGESLRGWEVLQVETRQVVLERNGKRETLRLKYGGMPGISNEVDGGSAAGDDDGPKEAGEGGG